VGEALKRFYQERFEVMDTILVELGWHFQEAGIYHKAINYLHLSGEKAE
jgi:hypothetical protein